MYLPSLQTVFTASLVSVGLLKSKDEISSGQIIDYCEKSCLVDGKQACTTPFIAKKSTCYNIEWSTDGALSHTTAEFRDAKSKEIVYYRDTNGDFTPEKSELVFVTFTPKTPRLCNSAVDYTIKTCK